MLKTHAPAAVVAVAVVVLSLAEGGYSPAVYAGAAILAWGAVIVGFALGAWPRGEVPSMAIAAAGCLVALAVFAVVSVGWATDNGLAVAEAVRWAGYAGLFVLVIVTTRQADARQWLAGIAVGLGVVAVIALSSRIAPGLPGGDDEIATLLPGAVGRLSFPIGYWNALAACMALAIVLLTWLGVAARARVSRALAVAAIPLCALPIYLASSRGGFAAAVVGVAALIALGPNRPRLLAGLGVGGAGAGLLILFASQRDELVDGISGAVAERQGDEMIFITLLVVALVALARWALDDVLIRLSVSPTLGRASAAVLAVVIAVGIVASDPTRRLDEFNDAPDEEFAKEDFVAQHLTSSSGSGRYQFWSTAMDAFEEEPLGGVGAGGYGTFWNQNGSIQRSVRDAHSLFFESLAELGIAGFALVLAFLVLGPIAAVRRLRDDRDDEDGGEVTAALALLATGIASAAIDWTWEVPAAFASVVVAVALLTGASAREPLSRGEGRRGWGVAAMVAGATAVVVAGAVFLSELKLDSSRAAARDGDIAEAGEDAQDARALQPWAAEPRLQLALVDELRGDLEASRAHLDEAIERSPEDWRLWLFSARIETNSGDIAKASAALRRARELNPKAPIFPAEENGQ